MNYRSLIFLGKDKKYCMINGIKYRSIFDTSIVNTHRKLSYYTHEKLAQFTHADLNKNVEIEVTE